VILITGSITNLSVPPSGGSLEIGNEKSWVLLGEVRWRGFPLRGDP